MKFIPNVDKKDYIKFTSSHEKSHFLQSYEWGEFCRAAKGQIPHYVGMSDNEGKLVATALILEKKTPLGYSYGYSPRGFLIDYKNYNYIKEFTDYLKQYMIDNKYIYIKFDPDIKYQEIDQDAHPISNGENNYKLYDYMKSIGYKHTGFYKLYQGNQPRYTFRINLKKDSFSEVEEVFNKSFSKSVKRSYDYDLIIDNEVNVNDFYRLIMSNSSKDDFDPHSDEYYQKFVDNMGDTMKFYNASIEPKKLVEKVKIQLKEQEELLKSNPKKSVDINNKIMKLKKDLNEFSKIEEEKIVVCSLICTYTKNRAWSLYIGSDNIANQTFAVSRCYYEAIKDAYFKKLDFFDLFGTVGDPSTTYKNLARLHDYKRKFGDEYIEFIGEFDLVNKKLLYEFLPIMLKVYRKLRR
jgi:serine/alanine adding enzyme